MKNILFDPPESGCVLYAPGLPGGGSFLHDRSAYGNHGSITGAGWFPQPDGFHCLDFDGIDDIVTISDKPWLEIVDHLTVIIWFRLTDVTDWRYIIAKDGVQEDTYMMRVNQTSGLLYCRLTNGAFNDSVTCPAAVNDGKWHQGCFNHDLSWLNLYVDGVPAAAPVPKTVTVAVNNSQLTIGGWTDPGRKFKGQIALPHIYNRVLSPLEIRREFDREKYLFGVW